MCQWLRWLVSLGVTYKVQCLIAPKSSVKDGSYSRVPDICQIPICPDLSCNAAWIGLECTWCIWGLERNRHSSHRDETEAADVAGHELRVSPRGHQTSVRVQRAKPRTHLSWGRRRQLTASRDVTCAVKYLQNICKKKKMQSTSISAKLQIQLWTPACVLEAKEPSYHLRAAGFFLPWFGRWNLNLHSEEFLLFVSC